MVLVTFFSMALFSGKRAKMPFVKHPWSWRMLVLKVKAMVRSAVASCGLCPFGLAVPAFFSTDKDYESLIVPAQLLEQLMLPAVLRIKNYVKVGQKELVNSMFATNICEAKYTRKKVCKSPL